jgi:hypothetical protein
LLSWLLLASEDFKELHLKGAACKPRWQVKFWVLFWASQYMFKSRVLALWWLLCEFSQIIFITLFSISAQSCCAFYQQQQTTQLCWAKLAYVGSSASNFIVQDHCWRCSNLVEWQKLIQPWINYLKSSD